MENLTLGQFLTVALAAASAIVLLANAVEKIAKIVSAARRPNDEQNERINALELEIVEIKRKLDNDKKHLESIDDGNKASQQALLALLDHGIDGNNIEQMQDAKKALRLHLIGK